MANLTRYIISLLLTAMTVSVVASVKASYHADLLEETLREEKRLQDLQKQCYTTWRGHHNYYRCLRQEKIIPNSGM